MLGTRAQTKLSVTYTRGRLLRLFHPSVLGCSLRPALLQQIRPNCALFTSRLTEVFAYFLAPVAGGRTSGEPYGFRLQNPRTPPLNCLLISQIGSNLLQKCANLSGVSAGETTLHNSKAKAAPPTNRGFPACGPSVAARSNTIVLSTAFGILAQISFLLSETKCG